VSALAALWRRARRIPRGIAASVREAASESRPLRCGWVTAHTLSPGPREYLGHLGPVLDMHVSNNALWINAHSSDVWNEAYRRERRYAVVIFAKAMDAACQAEARRVQAYGGKVVFDANVNYYEVWGEYDVPGTRPTEQQQRDAVAMTSLADWVVADSSYLLDIVKKHNPRACWIPDNVDLALFRGTRRHEQRRRVRLVWCGVSKKARHLLLIRDVLARLEQAELVVVSDSEPEVLGALGAAIPCRYVPFSNRRYARTLLGCDVIVSPKRLVNGYELGHTEYKITPGMAVGLPAIASPQRSYVEAIRDRGGGIVAEGPEEWLEALRRLVGDAGLRAEMGALAQQTVRARYATPVVAAQYLELIRRLA
jgi:glycosyltransferase involved in cell wall biosynthesis